MSDTYTLRVPIQITIDYETMEDIIDTALAAGWGWWGAARLDPGDWMLEIEELDDDAAVVETHQITYGGSLAHACARIITGAYPIRPDLAGQVRTLLTDDPDIDADAADCILQLAVFGEVRYG